MLAPIPNIGTAGIIYDKKPYVLPPEAWSDGRNIRFIDGSVYPSYGHQSVLGIPRIVPYHLHSAIDTTFLPVYAYCGTTDIYATDESSHQEITRVSGDYTGNNTDLWNSSNFGNIALFNNGIDVPQAWINPALGTKLIDLANWPSTLRSKVLRVFGRYLIALDVSKSGTRYPFLVKWSHQADLGAVPSTWDETDETKDAGEWPLTDTNGQLVDCLTLGDVNYVYKTDCIHSMRYIGGQYIFKFDIASTDFGLLSQRCVAQWRKKHVVISQENVHLFDGQSHLPLLNGKFLRWFTARIDSTNAFRSFLAMNYLDNEAWVCFPEAGNTFPTLAMIINLETGAITVKDLPNLSHIEYNRLPSGIGTTFDEQTIAFDSMVGYYGQTSSTLTRKRMVGVAPTTTRNMFLRSNDFTNGVWTKTNVTLVASAFSDSTTALVLSKIQTTVTNAAHQVSQSVVKEAVAAVYIIRATMRLAEYTAGKLILETASGSVSGVFNLSTGVVHTTSNAGTATGAAGTITETSSGSGIWICELSGNMSTEAAVIGYLRVLQNTGASETYAGNGTDGIHAGSMQIRQGSLSTTYQLTTTIAAYNAFYLIDSTYKADGIAFEVFMERTGLTVDGLNRDGSLRLSTSSKKFVNELWPKMELINGSGVEIYIGGQEVVDGAINYDGPFMFNPQSEVVVEPAIECRLTAIKFRSANGEFWRLTEYELGVNRIGKF